MSASALARLLAAERLTRRDAACCRRWYRKSGMPEFQVRYYSARCAWPDALTLVRTNGAGPYPAF